MSEPNRTSRPSEEINAGIEDILDRFEEAWEASPRPALELFLPTDSRRQAALIGLVHVDLERRLKECELVRVEAYLVKFPELAANPSTVLDLILAERRQRLRGEPDLDAEEYVCRFPQFQQELRDRLHSPAAAGAVAETVTVDQPSTLEPVNVVTQAAATGSFHAQPEIDSATMETHREWLRTLPEWQRRLPKVEGYEVLGELGEGGMGVVYKARDKKLNRLVALKMVLSADYASSEKIVRFLAEAEVVARLRHPNIIQIFELGRHQSHPYFTMEYAEGGSLGKRLNATPLPARQAAQVIETLAGAMDAAHRQGIVHRDLKPENILLSMVNSPASVVEADGHLAIDGQHAIPKITDFGLAKRLEQGRGLTRTGAQMGTPSYMAPEQAAGKINEIGPATDVYALGAILYEMMTGRPPFRAETSELTMLQVISDDPVPPSRLQPRLSRDLETICLKCLEKDPAKRYATAEALGMDLRRWLAGETILARPVGRLERAAKLVRRRPLVAALLGLMLVLTAAGLGGIAWAYGEAITEAANARKAEGHAYERTDAAEKAEGKAREEADNARKAESKARERTEAARQAQGKAREEADNARKAEEKTKEQVEETRRQLANSHLMLADAAWRQGLTGLAEDWLDEVPPHHRRWEWHYLKRAMARGLFTLEGHSGEITRVCFSPDAQRLASASKDNSARVWDARTGKELLTLKGHTHWVNGVCFSPDGERVATASEDRTARVWNARTGQERLALKGHSNFVTWVCFSPDGQRLATASYDQTVRVWCAHTGQELLALKRHTNAVLSVCFSSDGQRLATASADRTARVWDARTGQELLAVKGAISDVCFSPDGQRLATASADTARLWDARTGQALITLKGHSNNVNTVCFSPDGQRLATGGIDQTARVWDARTGQELIALKGHISSLTSVCFSPDGQRLATASEDTTARVWDSRVTQDLLTLKGHTSNVTSICFSPDGQRLATLAGNAKPSEVKVWDARTGQELFVLKGHTNPVLSVCFSPDGQRLATGGGGNDAKGRVLPGEAKVWDARTGQELLTLKGYTRPVLSVCFSPDGQRLATGAGGDAYVQQEAKVWDARTGRELLALKGHGLKGGSSSVNSVCFSPDGQRLATASIDQTARVWDARTGQELLALKGHENAVNSVCFSPDGERLATHSSNDTARVWDTRTGQELLAISGHTSYLSSVCFSPDGQRLATASRDQTARLWNARTGQALLTLKGHAGWVFSVCFSPDGQRLATAGEDRTVRLWDARSGLELLTLKGHTGRVTTLCFSADGQRLATGGGYVLSRAQLGEVKVWDARPAQEILALKRHTDVVSSVCFSPDAQRLATGSADRTTRLWDAQSGQELLVLTGHGNTVNCVCFSPDGQRLATAGNDEVVRVWDARTGRVLHNLKGHTSSVLSVCFSADGQRLVTMDDGDTALVWDARTGERLNEPPPQSLATPSARSPDRQLFAQIDGTTVRLLRSPDAEELFIRRARTSLDAAWHREQTDLRLKEQNALAAAFHLELALAAQPADAAQAQQLNQVLSQAVRERPELVATWRRLALVQLRTGQADAFRTGCREMVQRTRQPGDVRHALLPFGVARHGPLGAAISVAVLRSVGLPPGACPPDRLLAIRTAVLLPGVLPQPESWLPLLPPGEKLLRGAVLCRAGKHAEAVQELAEEKAPLGCLFRALAEHGRGNRAVARQALAEAVQQLPPAKLDLIEHTPLPWQDQVEIATLRAEIEPLLGAGP